MCDASMAAKYYGKDTDPERLNQALKDKNGFQAGSGNYIWGSITKVYSDIKERVVSTPSKLTDAQINEIKIAIDAGYPVALHIDVNPKTVENDQHWVLAFGYNPDDENDITIADPLGGRERSLKDYLGWYKPSVRNTIERYVIWEGKPPKNTVAVPADIYPNIIHGSTEWDKTVAQYVPDHEPKDASFEDVQKVVSGIKSEATAAKNKAGELEVDLAAANTEVTNQKEKLANIEAARQREYALLKSQYDALKQSQPNIDKLVGQYTGTIEELEGQLREAQKLTGTQKTQITTLENQLKQAEAGIKTTDALTTLIEFVRSLWNR